MVTIVGSGLYILRREQRTATEGLKYAIPADDAS
jgi:hypothetical protein